MSINIGKRALKKYLYQCEVPATYRKTIRLINAAISDDDDAFAGTKAGTVLQIKRALEMYRKDTGKTSAAAVEAEISLLEKAAEMGDNSAIALLIGSRLSDAKVTKEDFEHGSRLLKQLLDAKFPLAAKIAGDLAYQMGGASKAAHFYEIAEKTLDDKRLRVECLRNLGHISFRDGQLLRARRFFTQACKEAEDLKQVADCHFYLAQLRESDRDIAKHHLTLASAAGLSEATLQLGLLYLNYYDQPVEAQDWLQLAVVTDKTGQAAVGLLDCAIRAKVKTEIILAVDRIRRLPNGAELLESRAKSLQAALGSDFAASGSPHTLHLTMPPTPPSSTQGMASSRWGV